MKKLLALVLVVLMAISLVACAKTETPAASSSSDKAATETKKDDAAAADDSAAGDDAAAASLYPMTADGQIDYANLGELSAVELSICVTDADKCGKDARSEYIKQKFNLTFDYIPVSWGDWNEKVQTWVATDDAPDLLSWDLKIASSTNYFEWAKQGAFAGMTADELKNYPNLYNFYKDSPSCAAYSIDDVLYTWPATRYNPEYINNAYTSYFCIRADWAKQVGLYQEDSEYTWDEWIELLRAIRDQDPGNNGINNAPLTLPTWGFPNAAVTFLNAPASEGNESSSYIVVDGEYVWPASTPEFKQAVIETYNMYQEGLIYKDNISFTGNEYQDMFKAGQCFATYNVVGSMNSWTDDMMRDGTIASKDAVDVAVVYGMDGKWYMTQTEDYWLCTSFSHKITDEEKARALLFYDYLFTDEGVRLEWVGLEGVDYEVTGDNVEDIKILWDFDEATQTYVSPYAETKFNEGQAANGTMQVPANPAIAEFQVQLKDKVWNKMNEGKATMKYVDYAMAALDAPNKNKYGTFGADVKEEMTILVAQEGIDVGAEWDAWVASMMPTVQLVLDELNSQILGK